MKVASDPTRTTAHAPIQEQGTQLMSGNKMTGEDTAAWAGATAIALTLHQAFLSAVFSCQLPACRGRWPVPAVTSSPGGAPKAQCHELAAAKASLLEVGQLRGKQLVNHCVRVLDKLGQPAQARQACAPHTC